MEVEVLGDAIAAHRCCHRRRRTGRLARGRDARPRRHRCGAGRSASGLSAGLPLREARRRAAADTAADRPRRRGDCALRRRTRNAGWRGTAGWSTSCRANSSAASATTRWSTPCVRRFRAGTEFVHAKVTDIATGPERQTVKLSNGEEISARLVVMATGLNIGVRQKLGIDREVISPGHSISIGFDVQPAGRPAFPFSSLTYFTERAADRDGLHHAVSDRRHDARQHVRLSRPARSLAEAIPRCSRARRCIAHVAEACAK